MRSHTGGKQGAYGPPPGLADRQEGWPFYLTERELSYDHEEQLLMVQQQQVKFVDNLDIAMLALQGGVEYRSDQGLASALNPAVMSQCLSALTP